MQAIKSIWTKPPGFFWDGLEICTSLSVLNGLRHFGSLVVYADALGESWFKSLRLPGKIEVIRAMDDCPVDPFFWVGGKLWAYELQSKRGAFVHTDFDVFVGDDWPQRIKSASVLAERGYWQTHDWAAGLHMPEHWRDAIGRGDGTSFNCGTFGGNDLRAISRIARAGLDFCLDNWEAAKRDAFKTLDAILICEEWAIAREYDWREVSTVLPSMPIGGQFASVASSYHHRLVSKRKPEGIAEMRGMLDAMLPGQSKRCDEVRKGFPAAV